jgi:UDP-glucose 4-epimerase
LKILITGSKGFIGSVLAYRAREQGHQVINVDDDSRGLNEVPNCLIWDCRQGISHILDEFTYSDSKPPVDAVVHLAAGTGSLSRPYEELCELNISMTKKIYEETVAHKIPVFVFPTTSLIEGVPDSPYVKSKQDAMDWLLTRDDGVKVIPLQFYNVTGGYKNCSEIRRLEVHIIPIMLDCFMNHKTFIINGDDYYETKDHSPGRDFSNVCDVTDFILHLINRQLTSPFKCSNVIKVGTGVTTTALEMVQMFNDILEPRFNRKLDFDIGPRRAFDCGALRCDQPYLHVFKTPTMIRQSLADELEIILKVVYNE